jgi:hypothetical protein
LTARLAVACLCLGPLLVAGVAAPARAQTETLPGLELEEPDDSSPILLDSDTLDARLRQTEELVKNQRPTLVLGGYIDFGFFVPTGNGAGYVQDFSHAAFPEYRDRYAWVFLGDILAPAVNSRGEVADLGDAPGVDRFDSINSRGAPGFALNELNLSLRSSLGTSAIVSGSVNFTPRTGSDFRLGDSFDVDLAQIEWMPTQSQRTSIFAGKIESVLGVEYRDRKSNNRFGITPSLIARYTTGPALGLKLRTKFGADDWLVVAAALTNGSNTTEQFHFYDELDSNVGKTVSGRLSVRLPVGGGVEVGLSGSFGPQDRARDSAHPMWFVGPDLLAHFGRLDVKAQFLTGRSDGEQVDEIYGLRLHGGGYLELDAMLTPAWGVLGRIEYRDALVWQGSDRAYLTKSWRGTLGLRWVIAARATLKAEYLHNGEYGDIPSVRNDVFTSSLVLSY